MSGPWRWVIDRGPLRIGVATSRRDLTTSTVVIDGRRALLVDPAWEPDELAALAVALADDGTTVVAGFATHGHHDHLLWHPDFGPAPRFASRRTADTCARERARIVEQLGPDWPADLVAPVGRVAGAAGDTLDWPGPTVQLLTHDAHSPGHTALWLPAHSVLIAGDMLSDVELPLLEESSAAEYAVGLELLRPYVAMTSVLIPGHGHPTLVGDRAAERWRADRDYLNDLVAGTEPADPRLGRAGMRTAHQANVAAVRSGL